MPKNKGKRVSHIPGQNPPAKSYQTSGEKSAAEKRFEETGTTPYTGLRNDSPDDHAEEERKTG